MSRAIRACPFYAETDQGNALCKPLAEIVPANVDEERLAWIGSMKNSVKIKGDIISPANDEDEWAVLRD